MEKEYGVIAMPINLKIDKNSNGLKSKRRNQPKINIQKLADKIAKKRDCDIILYNGITARPADLIFITEAGIRRKRKNVVFILVTSGGSADAAFRIGRALQRYWEKVTIVISGWCKSAGTLLAIAAHELIIFDTGELGPLDVQIIKKDDPWSRASGLTEDSAIKSLEGATLKMVENMIDKIEEIGKDAIAFRTATELASDIISALLNPICAQIDPLKIGENSRLMNLATDYGKRLAASSKNLKAKESMEQLSESYSDHGFVIDREEACRLFKNVHEPDIDIKILCETIGIDGGAYVPLNEESFPIIKFLNTELSINKNEQPESKKNGKAKIGEEKRNRRSRAVVDVGRNNARTNGAAKIGSLP